MHLIISTEIVNSTNDMNVTLPSRGIPHVIEIPKSYGPVKHQLVSKSSFTYYDSERMSPGSEATKRDLEETKRMVKEMKDMPASTVFAKFGLVDGSEGDVCNQFTRRVSVDTSN
ncbi:hypothetical protein ACHAWO_005531 [Cyclotella atomus]|jgi:hypothetical protein|uniref:Uncharacterized protein n=1 Tax=Cyclotella atomus TaxID=382360 RepID=A0ABD3NXS4_9STRA